MVRYKTKEIWEFGDFQTPDDLAHLAIEVLNKIGVRPQSIIEPTCGRGNFLIAATEAFSGAQQFIGVEINKAHLDKLYERIAVEKLNAPIKIFHADFFTFNWDEILCDLPQPILILGNPPWVTSAELGVLQSSNLPQKSNFQGHNGFEARTGKSNFDISEWMLLKYLSWLQAHKGTIAILCKTAVARKALTYAWKHKYPINAARIYKIDALKYFNASVDACFFVVNLGEGIRLKDCEIYENLVDDIPSHTIGYHNTIMVADVTLYEKWKHLSGTDNVYKWRSGIKHDCSKVMELEWNGKEFRNGNDVRACLEEAYIYPLFKSSDIGNGRTQECRKYMLVTQQSIGEDTAHIKEDAPKTWRYLQDNAEALRKRASSIYRNQPPFSIFGVGDYTFASWKVAISGFYKTLNFEVIGPIGGRPAILDDTVYFLPFESEEEAKFIANLLNSHPAREFFSSMIFWSDKRPITIDLLKRLNIGVLAFQLDLEEEYMFHASVRSFRYSKNGHQLTSIAA